MVERSRVRVPASAAGEFSSPGSAFSADSCGHSAKKVRWLVTAKHIIMHPSTYVALHEVMRYGAWLYGVHRMRRDGGSFE